MDQAHRGRQNVGDASEDDAVACSEIYAPYVLDTAVTFETDPPSAATMADRIATASRRHAWQGAWHDVAWRQRVLASGEDPPGEPI